MNPNSKPSRTYYHSDRELNLQAAKRSLRSHRDARMCRRASGPDDVIDIIEDDRIIERYIAKVRLRCAPPASRRCVPIEEMALYQ